MDPEIEKRFEELDVRLRLAERGVLTTGNLVGKVGIPSLVEAQMKIDALMESDVRLYGTLQQLAESQQKTDEALRHLSATVQAFFAAQPRLV